MLSFSSLRPQSVASLIGAVLGTAVLIIGGCDTSVDVINPSDQHQYSLFGVLNVAADTQVIRVEPLGDSTRIGAPPTLGGTVVLENLDTDTERVLQDSFATVGRGTTRVHNTWTSHPIQPSTTYRISVRRDGETVTSATTITPSRPPSLQPDLNHPFLLPCELNRLQNPIESENTFRVQATNTQAIAAAKVIYPLTFLPNTRTTVDHLSGVSETAEEKTFEIAVFYGRDLATFHRDTPNDVGCVERSEFAQPYALLAVAAGGPNWPDWRGLPLNEVARPDSFSNVEGGHGFVGGIYSDTMRVPIQQR